MNDTNRKTNELKKIMDNKFSINVSNKWLRHYLYLYAKCVPLPKITAIEAISFALKKPETFAYFIYGIRSEYVNDKKQLTAER